MNPKIFAETDRLIMRELLPGDDTGMFELDSDPDVHTYLGRRPIKTIDEAREIIAFVRQQYIDNGIGRWAVIEKANSSFIGWSGLKLITETINNRTRYYDVGYRFIKKYWGKGYATEAAIASLAYGFTQIGADHIHGITDVNNIASGNVLLKAGLKFVEVFQRDGYPNNWYGISATEWLAGRKATS